MHNDNVGVGVGIGLSVGVGTGRPGGGCSSHQAWKGKVMTLLLVGRDSGPRGLAPGRCWVAHSAIRPLRT